MIQVARNLLVRHSGVNWALGDQALISGVNFLTGIMLARFLGLEDFGRFTLAWMAVQFVNAILFALVSAPMLNIGPKQEAADRPAYYGAVLIQQVCFAALASALLWALASTAGTVFPDWRAGELALPPLPKNITLPPARRESSVTSTSLTKGSRTAARVVAATRSWCWNSWVRRSPGSISLTLRNAWKSPSRARP